MAGFDFSRIGNVISQFFDSDFIDIKRNQNGKLQEIYSNVPCHLAYSSTDNPDPTSVDIKPIIQTITIHCALWVDIRNDDFIVAKKASSDGSLLATYSGRCGNPVVSQGRKRVVMQMKATESDESTPLPPKESAKIKIKYLYENTEIQSESEQEAEIRKPFEVRAPIIEGFSAAACLIDGIPQESENAFIAEVQPSGHIVSFLYVVSESPEIFRFLLNGVYTKDDGGFAVGWHLYKKISIDVISRDGEIYTITCADEIQNHEDSGKIISIEVGAKIVLIPNNVFLQVERIISRENGNVTFACEPFEPTNDEKNAYVCGWYD